LVAGSGRLAELAQNTIAELSQRLPTTWSRGNPIDIIGDAPGARYADALAVLISDPEVDAILVLNAAEREQLAAIAADRSRPRKHVEPTLVELLALKARRE
jgi:acyl-CoA synthetase (NDP forming)